MFTRALHKILVILFLFVLIAGSYGQGSGLTEDDLIKKAQSFFDKENYQEALPLFAQLVSVHPENPEYNYKFGVCTLYGDRSDRRRPIRYLSIALRSIKDDPKLHYYLGIAYYQNQEFADAMKYLNLYLAKLGSDSPERPVILEKVNACLNGMNLEHKNIISEIVSTSQFDMDNFHRAYRADEFSGMLIIKPDMFLTSKEKKSGENSFVYISQPRRILYFSGYDGNSDQRDLFKVEMTEKGDWGDPEKLPESINTSFDEDYPIGIEGGITLYFCSKGHNSLGGYDVFKTTLDTVNNTFSEPENLGVGINSPFDDLMFIPDKTGQYAYFATNRDNLNGTINVYKIRLIENSLEENQFLAENVIKSNLGQQPQQVQAQPQQTLQQSSSSPSQKPKQTVASASVKPELTPAERAAKMKNERSLMNKYADTSYQLVTTTKSLIRDLTNKRDRANALSQKKQEAAKSLEVKFEEMMATMATVESEVEFEKMLENSLVLKKEIYQYRQRADQANLVAWNLGKQIKIKSSELEKIKAGAGKVQTNSVAGKVEDTRIAYLELRNAYNLSDTLTDYNDLLFALTSDEMKYEVPASELAYADDMKKGFQNNTLLAKAAEKPVQEDIPIVVVDKRTQFVEQPKPKPTVKPEPQVEIIPVNTLAFTDQAFDDESLELNFNIDAVTPVKQVEAVEYKALAQVVEVDETSLDIDLEMDLPEILPQVEPVVYAAADLMPADEDLEINTAIDAIDPYQLIEPVNVEMIAGNFQVDEPELELDLKMDIPEILSQVEPVVYAAADLMPSEEDLEINTAMDAIEPYQLVEVVNVDLVAGMVAVDETELEINTQIDAVDASPLVEPVMIAHLDADFAMDEDLEIDQSVDAAEVVKQVEMVEWQASDEVIALDNESIELDMSVDAVDALGIVEPVIVAFSEQEIARDETLDINMAIDAAEIVPQVEFVNVIERNFEIAIEDETLDVDLAMDAIEVLNQIKEVSFDEQAYASAEPEEEDLEISLEAEYIKAQAVAEQIALNRFEDVFPEDEPLEINIEQETVSAIDLVEPVYTSAFVMTDIPDESLELGNLAPEVKIYELIEPVQSGADVAAHVMIPDEDLEISIDPVEADQLVQPVFAAEFAMVQPEEEELEIRFNKYEQLLMTMPEQVEQIFYSTRPPVEIEPDESDVVISFGIDDVQDQSLMASADNSVSVAQRAEDIPEMPSITSDVFYLRESVSLSSEIESTRTDMEVLRTALTDPEDLEYEELLYAASLTSNSSDQLNIYHTAFVHLDRDWRAFNNAAVTSINVRDLDQAEVFLYQASLLSQDNGKIYNNMGILACYQNNFDKARDYFVTALQLGVNTEYNLSVLKTMTETNSFTTEKLHQEIGEHRYFEVLGDVLNYGGGTR